MGRSEKLVVIGIVAVIIVLLIVAVTQIPSVDPKIPGDRGAMDYKDPWASTRAVAAGAVSAGSPGLSREAELAPPAAPEPASAPEPSATEEVAPVPEEGSETVTPPEAVVEEAPVEEPSRAVAGKDGVGLYVVQPGDTYSDIAEKLLGSSRYWKEIQKANEEVGANTLPVGRTLVIPYYVLAEKREAGLPARAVTQASWEGGSASAPVHARGPGTYVVQRGDTLFSIARRYGISVGEILRMNREVVGDPDRIRMGEVLRVPAR